MVSPVVILITLGLESIFDALPIARAPLFADSGILDAWRSSSDNVRTSRGETALMLTIVLATRVLCASARRRGSSLEEVHKFLGAHCTTPTRQGAKNGLSLL